MNRREFLMNAYRMGGLYALLSLGISKAEARGILMMAGRTPSGPTYGVGNLLSERFTAIGTWTETQEGDGTDTWNDTTISGTGFANHLTVSGTADWQENVMKDIGAQSAVYFRFYFVLNSQSWSDGYNENIFTLAPNGGNMGNGTYVNVFLLRTGTQMSLEFAYNEGTQAVDSGSFSCNISEDTIYQVSGKITDDGATGSVEWYVRNSSLTQLATGAKAGIAAFGTVAVQDIHIGITYNGSASSLSFDTLDIDSTGYPTDSL